MIQLSYLFFQSSSGNGIVPPICDCCIHGDSHRSFLISFYLLSLIPYPMKALLNVPKKFINKSVWPYITEVMPSMSAEQLFIVTGTCFHSFLMPSRILSAFFLLQEYLQYCQYGFSTGGYFFSSLPFSLSSILSVFNSQNQFS